MQTVLSQLDPKVLVAACLVATSLSCDLVQQQWEGYENRKLQQAMLSDAFKKKAQIGWVLISAANCDEQEMYKVGLGATFLERAESSGDRLIRDQVSFKMIPELSQMEDIKGQPFLTDKLKETYNVLHSRCVEQLANLDIAFSNNGITLAPVTVQIEPRMAKISIDGIEIGGILPESLDHVPAGEHLISAQANGYQQWQGTLKFSAAHNTAINATLIPADSGVGK